MGFGTTVRHVVNPNYGPVDLVVRAVNALPGGKGIHSGADGRGAGVGPRNQSAAKTGYWTNTAHGRVWIGPNRKAGPVHANVPGITTGPVNPHVDEQTPKQKVMAMQRFLRGRGYDITVDGVRGPETNAAVSAFHNHVKGEVWSKTKNGTTGPVNPNPGSTPTPAPVSNTLPGLSGPPQIPNIDPYAYARGAVNAEYDPQIGSVQQQINQGSAQGAQNDADIAKWYSNLMDTVNKGTKDDLAQLASSLQGLDTSNKNVLGLFGGPGANPAADEAAAFQNIGRSYSTATGLAQGDYDRSLGRSVALQGVEARVNEKNYQRQSAAQLAQQLIGLKGAKGQAYNADLYQGIQAATQQQSALQSLDLARQLAPTQVATAQANATTAQINATNAPKLAQIGQQRAILQNQQLRQQLKLAKTGNNWNLGGDRTQRQQVEGGMRSIIQTPNGTFRVSPDVTWKNIQGTLASEGLSNNPIALQIANQLMAETVRNSHARKMWGMFNFQNGKVVKNGKPFPKAKK